MECSDGAGHLSLSGPECGCHTSSHAKMHAPGRAEASHLLLSLSCRFLAMVLPTNLLVSSRRRNAPRRESRVAGLPFYLSQLMDAGGTS